MLKIVMPSILHICHLSYSCRNRLPGLLTLSQTSLVFTCLQYKSFENTVGKGEIARNEQFLLFPQCFLPFRATFCHFNQFNNCRLQSLPIKKSLKFVVWERVKNIFGQVDYFHISIIYKDNTCTSI